MCEKNMEKTAFKTHLEYYEFKAIPFGLINASFIFQTLINSVLEFYLRTIMLVFFDDILIYSFTMELHISLFRTILKTLKNNQLFTKWSKCSLCNEKQEYPRYIIFTEGIGIDPRNTKDMNNWLIPYSVKELRSFVGLTSYYKKDLLEVLASPVKHSFNH